MKHKTVTVHIHPSSSYSDSALLGMALDQAGITMRELRAHEVLAYTNTRYKVVLWMDK